MQMTVLASDYALLKMPAHKALPSWLPLSTDAFFTVSRSAEELSIVCPTSWIPRSEQPQDGYADGYTAMKIDGQLDLSMVGVLANIAGKLKEARISIFAISTFNTDYILVPKADFPRAQEVLSSAPEAFSFH